MANLPEKNITTVDKITSIPSNTNLYINANGEFRQATIDDVLKASPVIADSITNQYKNANGSPILLTDSSKGVAIEFNAKGRSTQDGEPTPTEPITPKSNGDMGYFDGELLNGVYSTSNGIYGSNANYLCNKNPIPCNASDDVTFTYHTDTQYNLMILFYDEDMNYLSYKNTTTSDTLTATAPTNASYCNFNIGYGSALSIANASPITVTINDKYALIVDSVGKNLLENTATTQTVGGLTFTVNDDGIWNVTGTINGGNNLFINSKLKLKAGTYVLSGMKNVVTTASEFRLSVYDGTTVYANLYAGKDEVTFTLSQDMELIVFVSFATVGATVSGTIYPMLRLASVTDSTYEPYIKSRKYIPISAPLRGIGEVTDVASLSECEVNRKFTKAVFDGSSDETWRYFNTYDNYYSVSVSISNIAKTTNAVCSHFKNTDILNVAPNSGKFTINANRFVTFGFSADIATTLDEWKTWLQANPITVIYELAEPTTESIEPIEIVTYDNVTHISVSDDADMEVEYPTSKVAGIASIGWSKGRRAEYDLEQLKAQMLALQTTIVSTV